MQPEQNKHQYDFIMNSGAKPKRGLPLPNLGLPRPAKIALWVLLGIIVLVIIGVVLSSSKNSGSQPIISLMARAQELSRASTVAGQDSQDPNLQALTTTVSTALTSQEDQLSNYLSKMGQKASAAQLSADQNTATDAVFQTAVQNNKLSSAYANYVVSSLNSYAIELSNEYKKAGNPELKNILSSAYDSVQTLITSASPLQSAQAQN